MYRFLLFACFLSLASSAQQQVYVSPAGDNAGAGTLLQPWKTAQYALDHASAGTTVYLMGGNYHENLVVPVSGSSSAPITISGYAGQAATLDGSGTSGNFLLKISGKNNINVRNLHFTGLSVNNGSAILVDGGSSYVNIANNIFNGINFSQAENDPVIPGSSAHAVFISGNTVLASSAIEISGNEIHDCRTGESPAIEISGNIAGYTLEHNKLYALRHTAIGITGNRNVCPDAQLDQPRTGTISRNTIWNCFSEMDNGAGIILDGATGCLLENNSVFLNSNGMIFRCSAADKTTSAILCRNNCIYHNINNGIVLGNISFPSGMTENCSIHCNTFFENNTGGNGSELQLEVVDNSEISNNIIAGYSNNVLVKNDRANSSLTMNYNLYYSQSMPEFTWNANSSSSFQQWQTASREDSASLFINPSFVSAAGTDLHLEMNSAAIDHGDPFYAVFASETDMDTMTRVQNGRVDIGADEYGTAVGISESAVNSSIYYYDTEHSEFVVTVSPVAGRSLAYLYDASGKLLFVKEMKKGESTVSFSNCQYPSGIYIVKVNDASLKMSK
jgi:hypothetical protein